MKIAKIISGGQTGADRGGLDAAIYYGLPCGGFVPKGRRAEDGIIPFYYENLKETDSTDYLIRTEENIRNSDLTLIFCHGKPTGGSLATIRLTKFCKIPFITVDLDEEFTYNFEKIVQAIKGLDDNLTINIAGSRESKHNGIQSEVRDLITAVIARVNMIGGVS